MNSCLNNLQTAIYSTLNNDATLIAKVTGIYDQAPQETAFPYVIIGDFTSLPYRTHSRHGENVTITIHVYTKQPSPSSGYSILSDINRLLGDQTLAVTGYDVIHSWYEFTETIREDEEVRHLVVRFRIFLQEA